MRKKVNHFIVSEIPLNSEKTLKFFILKILGRKCHLGDNTKHNMNKENILGWILNMKSIISFWLIFVLVPILAQAASTDCSVDTFNAGCHYKCLQEGWQSGKSINIPNYNRKTIPSNGPLIQIIWFCLRWYILVFMLSHLINKIMLLEFTIFL